jgi:hypothetical protein
MIDRRELLTLGGLFGGLAGRGDGDGAAYGVGQMSDRAAQDVVNAVKGISTAVSDQRSFAEIAVVRRSQTDYLRANGHFPDFIDVAPNVWFDVHDWHIRLQQPLVLGRDSNGRYTLALGFTTLVLRHDAVAGFISTPYDNR